MNKQEIDAKVKEVFSDKDYVNSLLQLETPEEVQASLNAKGIALSTDEIISLGKFISKNADDEITDEELENVSGGCGPVVAAIGLIAGMVGVGVLAGAGMDCYKRKW